MPGEKKFTGQRGGVSEVTRVGSGINGKKEQHVQRCGDLKLRSNLAWWSARDISAVPRDEAFNWECRIVAENINSLMMPTQRSLDSNAQAVER